MIKIRIAALIAALACLGVLVAGCDSGTKTDDTATPATPGTAKPSTGGDKMAPDAGAAKPTTAPPGPGAGK